MMMQAVAATMGAGLGARARENDDLTFFSSCVCNKRGSMDARDFEGSFRQFLEHVFNPIFVALRDMPVDSPYVDERYHEYADQFWKIIDQLLTIADMQRPGGVDLTEQQYVINSLRELKAERKQALDMKQDIHIVKALRRTPTERGIGGILLDPHKRISRATGSTIWDSFWQSVVDAVRAKPLPKGPETTVQITEVDSLRMDLEARLQNVRQLIQAAASAPPGQPRVDALRAIQDSLRDAVAVWRKLYDLGIHDYDDAIRVSRELMNAVVSRTRQETKAPLGEAPMKEAERKVCTRIGCGRPANQLCDLCKQTRYCCRQCQVTDWKARHKNECRGVQANLPTASGLD
jgi:transposase